ncbi:PilN domain-containing protein [Methylomonas sp. UP202]|uniref:PilN domain-containing protein n=1 Tax=Methylomonas sp. UP202 TaxID=3040943 RepID=UPI00247AD5FC|nr:PilN domain-containing protein [Methylomonas sp. UP202]WGS88632.1 PilN domain-containing protein [Methylomonas sp. UP202]
MTSVSQLRFSDFQSLVKSGFAWWWHGLSELIPEHKRLAARPKKPIFLIAEHQKTILLMPAEIATASLEPLDQIHLPSLFDETFEDAIVALAPICHEHVVEVSLDHQDVLLLGMSLPKTAQSKLRDAVSFKLITESPLNRETIYFDTRTKHRTAADLIDLEVALCMREKIDNIRSILEKAGITSVRIGFSKSSENALDFIFYVSSDIASASLRLKKHLILFFSFILITAAFLPFTFFAASWIERDIRQENQSMQESLDTSSQLLAKRALLGTIKSDINNQIPSHRVTNILNDLAAALPKTSWITSIQYDKGILQITGNSPNVVEMMRELNKISTLDNLKLISVANSNSPNVPSQFELSIDFHR